MSDEALICDETPGILMDYASTTSDQENLVKDCLHKWGYRLGRAPGSNKEIADAVIGKCRSAIDGLLGKLVQEGNQAKQPMTDEVWKLHTDRFNQIALTRVVEGRAGNCSIRGADQK